MATRPGLVLALACVILAGAGAWRLGWLDPVPPAPQAAPRPSPPPPFESAWATEEDWIVDTITSQLREMATFAATRSLPDGHESAFPASALALEEHIFSPAAYALLATEVLAMSGPPGRPKASGGAEDSRLLAALLDLRPEVLVRESETVSRRLEREPGDPAAHERAALLLGAFALRENAGRYSDERPVLCRMTAHLAFARALRGSDSVGLAGRFDEALLDTLVGRQRVALARLDALEHEARSRAERAWVRALRLRNTRDWRIARDAPDLTLLETLEEFAALAGNLDDLEALSWLDQRNVEPIADWGRIVLNGGFSVQSGNRFAPVASAVEMAEAAEVWTALRHEAFDDMDRLLDALNQRPAGLLVRDENGAVRPAVLGWGLWADRAQRHLVFALVTESYHLGGMLGRSGAKKAFIEDARAFSRLELFPLFLRNVAVDEEMYRPAMAAARELALRSPERMTGGVWTLLRAKERYAPLPTDLPDETTWFRPGLLRGTLIDFHYREELLPEIAALSPARLQELRELAPYDIALVSVAAARQPGDERTLADLALLYGALADYNVWVMGKLADASWYDPPEFRRRQGALCDLQAERCFLLGHRLAELGFPDEAAVAYRKGFDRARDRVEASHQSEWLVQHYFERGRIDEAEAVARRAAGTHSATGLLVLAKLMEQTSRLREAEDLYRQVFETYDEPMYMAAFYYRQARLAGNGAYKGCLRDALALALPSGLEPFDRAALPPEPTDGVVVRKENDNTKRCGIKWGHVIVGFDGFRIRNNDAYNLVWALHHSPHMKLVVWRGTSYDDVEIDLWDRRFRVAMEDLAPAE